MNDTFDLIDIVIRSGVLLAVLAIFFFVLKGKKEDRK